MSRKRSSVPAYLLHKPTGQARCRIHGKDHYLGLYGSDASRIKYGQLIAGIANGIPLDPLATPKRKNATANDRAVDSGPTIGELCLAFLRHAETHYVKGGKPTSEICVLKSVIRPLNELFGLTPAADFGPLSLKAVRTKLVEAGWARATINAGMSRIRRVFRHAVENELIAPDILERLKAISPLLAGRTEAHDNPPRTSVSSEDIEAVRQRVRPMVRDLIDVQLLTGARSGELLGLTTGTKGLDLGRPPVAVLGATWNAGRDSCDRGSHSIRHGVNL